MANLIVATALLALVGDAWASGQCTFHGSCAAGEYCDVNHHCFDCSYTFSHACDAFDRADNPHACTSVCGAGGGGDGGLAQFYTFNGFENYQWDQGTASNLAYLNGVYTRSSDSCNGKPGA